MNAIELAGKTAIKRIQPSNPIKWLYKNRMLNKPILDYGCGLGRDVNWLNALPNSGVQIAWGYDPNHHNHIENLKIRFYQTITVTYVMNTLPEEWIMNVMEWIKLCLAPGGTAYFFVRKDVKKDGFTKKGTYQRNVLEIPGARRFTTLRGYVCNDLMRHTRVFMMEKR